MAVSAAAAPSDYDAIDLSRALARLEAKILTSPPARLRCSAPERTKTRANLEHARTLLLRLEHASGSSTKGGGSRKHAAQGQLARQRALVKRLTERLHDLETADDGTAQGSTGDDEETDDAFALLAPLPSAPAPAPPSITVSEPAQTPDATTTSGLRSRDPRTALLGAAATTTAHALPTPTPSEKGMAEPTAAALQVASTTQAELTSSMLDLAAALKKSARAFAADLDADSGALARAAEGLDKSKGGLDATTRGLGVLRRMSEGRWWWGRMVLMAAIVGLWFVLILLVFVGPKIRW